jgi:hypothetical protein
MKIDPMRWSATFATKSAVLAAASVALSASILAAAALVAPAMALAASPPQVAGATVLSSTAVKVVFDSPVSGPSATTLGNYSISPALAATGAALTDSGRGVVLTTAAQLNGQTYTVTVSSVSGTNGVAMPVPGSASFIGTTQGPNSTTSGHDDFNRPSGLVTTDTPIPGPWLSTDISTLNTLSLTSSTVFNGAGALDSYVSDTDPNLDNALVRYQLASRGEYWLSAYLYVPSGQGWGSQQEIGLIRLMENLQTSMARVSAIDQSSATHFGLDINWKTTGNAYLTTPPVIATDVPFDSWQWIEMHVQQAASGAPGEIQVWLNGRQIYGQNTIYVYPAKMTYSQVGIMHLVTKGPAAHVITDEARFGDSYQLPSTRNDTMPPAVALTSPSQGATIGSSISLAASASDETDVQRVDFLIDGTVVARDDLAPYQATYSASGLASGTHTIAAVAYDTSGNTSATSSVTVSTGGAASLTLTAPADGSTWQAGSAQTLSWSLGRAVSNGTFKAYAKNTSSGVQTLLTPTAVAAAAGQTAYNASYTVKLAAAGYSVFVNYYDSSGTLVIQSAAAAVTVAPITLTAPGGGAQWQAGSVQTASWSLVSPLTSGSFKVFAKNASTGTNSAVTGSIAVASGQIAYSTPLTVKLAAGSYAVSVTYYNSSGTSISKSTAATVTVLPITLTSPAAGATWTRGSAQTVSWTLGLPLSAGTFTVWARNTSTGAATALTPNTAVVAGQTLFSRAYTVSLAAGAYTVWVNYYDASGTVAVRTAANTLTVQ